jgi:putative lipoic acid-binding regulatory protein
VNKEMLKQQIFELVEKYSALQYAEKFFTDSTNTGDYTSFLNSPQKF